MCGFVGLASSLELGSGDVESLERAVAAIQHRGPDDNGLLVDKLIGLGHARLSILDLSDAASQPMISKCQRYAIAYNGEVYNFGEISMALNLRGLRSSSDTEVILEAFATIGPKVFSMLNGMFALALLDRYERKLWLVRDRLGIKPLYYTKSANKLCFGSEIKAIKAMKASRDQVNTQALGEWCYYGVSLGQETLTSEVNRLLPGHFMEVNLSNFETKINRYWYPTMNSVRIERDIVKQTQFLLERAVRRQLVSDVPIGIFLSGGIDSSAITAFASRHYSGRLTTYSAGFDFDMGVNELPMAKRLAKTYGTEHHEIHISGLDVADTLEKLVSHHDQPFSDAANIPLYLLSKKISGTTKVVLQGDGGDELFGGYQRYRTLSKLNRMRLISRLGKIVNFCLPRNSKYYERERYINALLAKPNSKTLALLLTVEDEKQDPTQIFHPRLRAQMSDPFKRYRDISSMFNDRKAADQMLLTDSMIILPDVFLEKVDRATMAASVEVRVPFLDNDLVEFCQQLTAEQKIPNGELKHLLKVSLSGVVPDSVLFAQKTGFGVPFGYWLKGPLREFFFDNLTEFDFLNPHIMNVRYIERKYEQHLNGQKDNGFLLWKLLNLLVWSNRNRLSWENNL